MDQMMIDWLVQMIRGRVCGGGSKDGNQHTFQTFGSENVSEVEA